MADVDSRTLPDIPNKPGVSNWVERAGGLPKFIERIAKHLQAKGKGTSHAIAIAVNVAKKMCASGDTNLPGAQQVNAKSRGEACKAVAEWEAKKGKSKAKDVAEAMQLAEALDGEGHRAVVAFMKGAEWRRLEETPLTGKARKNLSGSAFVFPETRRYPIHDLSHARNALARASGKPEEGQVRAAVYRRYPELKKKKKVQESKVSLAAIRFLQEHCKHEAGTAEALIRNTFKQRSRLPEAKLTAAERKGLAKWAQHRVTLTEGLLLTLNDSAPRVAKHRAVDAGRTLLLGKRQARDLPAAGDDDIDQMRRDLAREQGEQKALLEVLGVRTRSKDGRFHGMHGVEVRAQKGELLDGNARDTLEPAEGSGEDGLVKAPLGAAPPGEEGQDEAGTEVRTGEALPGGASRGQAGPGQAGNGEEEQGGAVVPPVEDPSPFSDSDTDVALDEAEGDDAYVFRGLGLREEPHLRVSQLQQRLGELGYRLPPDGVFGALTEIAVRKFQEDRGLDPSGEIDDSTIHALRKGDHGKQAKERARVARARDDHAGGSTGNGGGGGQTATATVAEGAVSADSTLTEGINWGDPANPGVVTVNPSPQAGEAPDAPTHPPALRTAAIHGESCAECVHFDGAKKCREYHWPVEPDWTCDSNRNLAASIKGTGPVSYERRLGETVAQRQQAAQIGDGNLVTRLLAREKVLRGRIAEGKMAAAKDKEKKKLKKKGVSDKAAGSLAKHAAHKKRQAGKLKNKSDDPEKYKVEEAKIPFDPRKHPKDRLGRWREVLGAMKMGDEVKLPGGVRVHKQRDGGFLIHRPGERSVVAKDRTGAAVRAGVIDVDQTPPRQALRKAMTGPGAGARAREYMDFLDSKPQPPKPVDSSKLGKLDRTMRGPAKEGIGQVTGPKHDDYHAGEREAYAQARGRKPVSKDALNDARDRQRKARTEYAKQVETTRAVADARAKNAKPKVRPYHDPVAMPPRKPDLDQTMRRLFLDAPEREKTGALDERKPEKGGPQYSEREHRERVKASLASDEQLKKTGARTKVKPYAGYDETGPGSRHWEDLGPGLTPEQRKQHEAAKIADTEAFRRGKGKKPFHADREPPDLGKGAKPRKYEAFEPATERGGAASKATDAVALNDALRRMSDEKLAKEHARYQGKPSNAARQVAAEMRRRQAAKAPEKGGAATRAPATRTGPQLMADYMQSLDAQKLEKIASTTTDPSTPQHSHNKRVIDAAKKEAARRAKQGGNRYKGMRPIPVRDVAGEWDRRDEEGDPNPEDGGAQTRDVRYAGGVSKGTPPPKGFTSWKPEVIADSSGKWAGNALRFGTKEEAEANVKDLESRWLLVRDTRVTPATEPPNYEQPLSGGRPKAIDVSEPKPTKGGAKSGSDMGYDPELPGGFSDGDFEMRDLQQRAADIRRAKATIKREVMAKFGGDLLGPALKSVEVSDEDAIAYLNGTPIEDLLPGGKPERGGAASPSINDGAAYARQNTRRFKAASDSRKALANKHRERRKQSQANTRADGVGVKGQSPGGLYAPSSAEKAGLIPRQEDPRKGKPGPPPHLQKGGAADLSPDARRIYGEKGEYLPDVPSLADTATREGDLKSKSISELAKIVATDWSKQGTGVNFGAKPYLDAMKSMESVKDNYGAEPGDMILAYFLSNARSWKGDTAKAVKAELKRRVGRK